MADFESIGDWTPAKLLRFIDQNAPRPRVSDRRRKTGASAAGSTIRCDAPSEFTIPYPGDEVPLTAFAVGDDVSFSLDVPTLVTGCASAQARLRRKQGSDYRESSVRVGCRLSVTNMQVSYSTSAVIAVERPTAVSFGSDGILPLLVHATQYVSPTGGVSSTKPTDWDDWKTYTSAFSLEGFDSGDESQGDAEYIGMPFRNESVLLPPGDYKLQWYAIDAFGWGDESASGDLEVRNLKCGLTMLASPLA